MRIPSLPFSPDDFLRYPKHSQLATSHAEAPTPERIAALHSVVRTGTLQEVENALTNEASACNVPGIAVLFMAVEEMTGNSLLHTAVLVQRIDVLDVLRNFRTHNVGPYQRVFYALFSYQRHDGSTILHSAVQSGNQEVLTAALQVFRGEYIDSPDERLQSDEAAARGGLVWGDDDEDGGDGETRALRLGELVFLLSHNDKGRTAADEARTLGHADLAAWLERATRLDDPQGQRDDASAVQLWRESCDEYYGLP